MSWRPPDDGEPSATQPSEGMFEEAQRAAFDRTARRYDGRWMRSRWPRNVLARCAVLDARLGHALDEGPVVEVGCGSGQMAEILLDGHPRLRWVGLDLSEGMATIARERLKRFGDRAEVRLVSGPLSLEPTAYCGGYGVDVLHHTDEPITTLSELRRALRPTSPAVFLEANPRFPVTTVLGLLQKHERRVLEISRPALQSWFESAGFQSVRTTYGPTYTPPGPPALARAFDRVDRALSRIPGARTLALHVVAGGISPS